MELNESLDLALVNLTSIPVLAFALGVLAVTLLRTDLRLPESVYKGLSAYLLLAIGLKGGVALNESGLGSMALPAVAAVALGIVIPLAAFHALGFMTRLGVLDRGAMAAHYGSTSLVTFTAALALIETLGLPLDGRVATLVVIMEIPGIVVGLALARRARSNSRLLVPVGASSSSPTPVDAASEQAPHCEAHSLGAALREAVTGPSVLLMAGGMAIGFMAGPAGYAPVSPIFTGAFTGVLALFLLHMGAVAGSRLSSLTTAGPGLIAFAMLFPLVAGSAGVLVGAAIGMPAGGAAVLGVLCASASYIAAPAAVGLALPRANQGLCLTSSLGLTFPFNLVIGIPVLITLAMAVTPS